MSDHIIRRELKVLDERMPKMQFYAEVREEVEQMPLEIIENGIVFELFDAELQEKGPHQLGGVVFYRARQE